MDEYIDISKEDFINLILKGKFPENREGLSISENTLELTITNRKVSDNIEISTDFNYNLYFENCEFKNFKIHKIDREKRIKVLSFKKVSANEMNFFELSRFHVTYSDNCICDQINFYNSVNLEVRLEDIESRYAEVAGDKIISNVTARIKNSKFKELNFNKFLGNLTLDDIIVTDRPVDIVGFKHNGKLFSTLTLYRNNNANINIQDVSFTGIYLLNGSIPSQNIFSIKDVKVKHFIMEKFTNFGEIHFSNLSALSSSDGNNITVKDTNFGNTKFINSDLISFEKVTIQDSLLTEIQSTGTSWPETINQENVFEKREVYRQLKYAMINQHDKINELHFYKLEMNAHYESLSWGRNYWDKLSLYISKLTNDFGTNYQFPIVLYFSGGLALFIFMLFISCKLNAEYMGRYFEFIDPTHKINFIKDLNIWSVAIDFFSRIYFAFLIFQIISAFRKFHRK